MINFGFLFSQRWFPEVQNIYYQGNKRKQVPSNQNAKRLESFFNAAAVLMTNQLQMLALNSIDDFTKLFCPPPVRFWFCFYIGAERVIISILHGSLSVTMQK